MSESPPLVSVVIPSYRSGKTIGTCLRSIRDQTYPNIEIIVVDKGSQDETAQYARLYSAQLIDRDCERAEAKNFGTTLAKGRFVVYIDSDMELTSGVISECVAAYHDDPAVGGLIIPERSVGASFWVKVRDHERQFYADTAIESARFFPRDVVQRTNGFDTDIVFFEESTLPNKIRALGLPVDRRIGATILHHEDNFSLGKWLRKKYYYGRTAKEYKGRFKEQGAAQMSPLERFRMFLFQPLFYKRPVLAAGVIVLKTLEFISAGLGYLAG